jgi:hypothetical protein
MHSELEGRPSRDDRVRADPRAVPGADVRADRRERPDSNAVAEDGATRDDRRRMDARPAPVVERELDLGDGAFAHGDDAPHAPRPAGTRDLHRDVEHVARQHGAVPPAGRHAAPGRRRRRSQRAELRTVFAQRTPEDRRPRKCPAKYGLFAPTSSGRPRHAGLDLEHAIDQRDSEAPRAGAALGHELRGRGYSSPPPGFLPAPRALFGFALCALITSSVMSIDLSL